MVRDCRRNRGRRGRAVSETNLTRTEGATYYQDTQLGANRELPREPVPTAATRDVAHEDAETTASPEAGRPWASGQLVFNAGSFESARSGFADYARDGESAKELRARVNKTILEDLEAKVLALRALHAKLRDMEAGESFGDIVARGRPKSEML